MMSPEHERLLNLLTARAFMQRAAETLDKAVLLESFELDGRSRLFENRFAHAVYEERFAFALARGEMSVLEDEP